MNDYYVYIVASPQRRLYLGITNDLRRRAAEHVTKAIAGYSASRDCVRLVNFQRFGVPLAAIAREKQLKGWRREKKVALIELDNKGWKDLKSEI